MVFKATSAIVFETFLAVAIFDSLSVANNMYVSLRSSSRSVQQNLFYFLAWFNNELHWELMLFPYNRFYFVILLRT